MCLAGPWASPSLTVACALRRETPIQYSCCSRERLLVVVDKWCYKTLKMVDYHYHYHRTFSRTKWYTDKMAWTKWYGQNGTDKILRIKSSINPDLIYNMIFSSILLPL